MEVAGEADWSQDGWSGEPRPEAVWAKSFPDDAVDVIARRKNWSIGQQDNCCRNNKKLSKAEDLTNSILESRYQTV